MLWTQSCTQKILPSLYLFADFNNSHIILTRFVSWFLLSIQNPNLITAAWSESFLKPQLAPVWSNFVGFWLFAHHFKRIVSQIWTCFRNQNLTIVAWTAMILVCVIAFPRQTEQGGWLIVSFLWVGRNLLPFTVYDRTSNSTLPTMALLSKYKDIETFSI